MPVHDLPFERLVDLSELATGGAAQRFDLFAGALSPPPLPVRWLAADGTERMGELEYRSMLPPVSVYAVPEHVLGRGGAARGGSVFWREDCHPNYLRDVFAGEIEGVAGHGWLGALGDAAAEVVDLEHPIADVLHPNTIYGHALLEMLPRIWLVEQTARLGRPLPVALDIGAPRWLADLVAMFVPSERIVRFDGERQVLRAPTVVVPSMMQVDYYLHPAFNLMAASVLDRALGEGSRPAPARRLFLSRRQFAEGRLSVIENADAVERRLSEAGFEILYPESMPFAEQLRAYAGASMIVSEYGSASHNALFAPIGCPQILLNRLNDVQERIAALRGQPVGIVEPNGGFVARLNSDTATLRPRPLDIDGLLRLVDRMAEPGAGSAGGTPAPVTLQGADRIEIGLFVGSMDEIGDRPRLAGAARVSLPAFLHAEVTDPGVAPFSRLFRDPGPHAYVAREVVCARLSGGVLLGDSGLVLWRGQVVADTANSGNVARAAGITLRLGPNGRPAPIPLDRRSHPGQTLFAAATGRWSDDAGFLAECLPRLVALTRLRATGTALTALVPASAPGSIQARALELLGLGMVEIVGPDQVVTGGQLWLPSGIDPWEPSPLVVEAARALSALVPPGADPTPTRLYLRGRSGVRPPLTGFDALEPVLRQHGFAVVTLADHDLDNRIRLLRGAEFVVAEAAGGLAHIAFCQPGARVLEMFTPASVQPTHYALAALGGLGYGFVVGQHVAEPDFPEPGLASGYAVTPDQLAAALGDLLRQAPIATPVAERPGALPLDPAQRLVLPEPFFAAPALPDLALDTPATRVVPHAGLAIDERGERQPADANATRIDGHLVATLAVPDATSLAALPRLLAARAVREQHPAARVVLPRSGPARRIGELLGLADTAVTVAPDTTLTAETMWTVDEVDAALPPDLLRRCGEAMRDAVPPIDAEAMGMLPTRIHLCAAVPDPLLDQALSPRAFVPVVWPNLSVDEQVRLMRVARRIVIEPGMAGALMLAHPGACVLEAGLPTARALAAVCGLKYGCVGDAARLGDAVAALLAEPLAA